MSRFKTPESIRSYLLALQETASINGEETEEELEEQCASVDEIARLAAIGFEIEAVFPLPKKGL